MILNMYLGGYADNRAFAERKQRFRQLSYDQQWVAFRAIPSGAWSFLRETKPVATPLSDGTKTRFRLSRSHSARLDVRVPHNVAPEWLFSYMGEA